MTQHTQQSLLERGLLTQFKPLNRGCSFGVRPFIGSRKACMLRLSQASMAF